MQFIGECSKSTYNNGIVKVLISVYSVKQPEYVLLNLVKDRGEWEEGETYLITIEKRVGTKVPT